MSDDLFGHQVKPGARRRGRYAKQEHPNFAEWWASYPRKIARLDAVAAYGEAIERGASAGELLTGLRNHVFTPDRQYQPYPATWLRQERWRDEPGLRPQTIAERDASRRRAILAAFPELTEAEFDESSSGQAERPPHSADIIDGACEEAPDE